MLTVRKVSETLYVVRDGFRDVAFSTQAAAAAAVEYIRVYGSLQSVLKNNLYDADKFNVDEKGNRFTAGGQLKPPDDSGDWKFVGDVRTSGSSSDSDRVNVQGQGYWVRESARQVGPSASGGNGTRAGTPLLGGGNTDTRPSGSGAANSSGGSGTYTVNINMSGNKAVINTATAADGQRLVDFLKALENSARAAGG